MNMHTFRIRWWLAGLTAVVAMHTAAHATPPVNRVYRFDTRAPSEIRAADGMYPQGDSSTWDFELARHYHGEERQGRHSGLVSTTASWEEVIELAAWRADREVDGTFEAGWRGYIYEIVPDSSFYHVRSSILRAADSAADPELELRLRSLVRDYSPPDDQEWAAERGFGIGRILRHTVITGDMLRANHWRPLESYPWEINPQYDRRNDHQLSNPAPYANVGFPLGYRPPDAMAASRSACGLEADGASLTRLRRETGRLPRYPCRDRRQSAAAYFLLAD